MTIKMPQISAKITSDNSGNQTSINNAGTAPLSSPSVGLPIVTSTVGVSAKTATVHGIVAGVVVDNPA